MIRPESLRGRLIASVPTPFDMSGNLHPGALRHQVSSLKGEALGGVAVGTPLGRGSKLSADRWKELMSAWREGLGGETALFASVGAPQEIRRPTEVFEATLERARMAADLGADALVVEPPGVLRGRQDRDRLVLEYHSILGEVNLPLLISYRREATGGVSYNPEVLAQLLARPEVIGVEIATIDGIATFQQVESLTRELAPFKLVVSGEERFLGYSLMCGADAAMVGMGAAFPEIVTDLLNSHFSKDAGRFMRQSARIDALARLIFAAPLEASASRLLRALALQGVIPLEAVNDPWGSKPGLAELERLSQTIARFRSGLSG